MALVATLTLLGILQNPAPLLPTAQPDFGFIENHGQWESNVRYMAQARGLDVWVTRQGLTYDFYDVIEAPAHPGKRPGSARRHNTRSGSVVEVAFVGANPVERTSGFHQQPGLHHAFVGSSSAVSSRSYGSVMLHDLYPGIDLVLRADAASGRPRYDLVVKPGGDPSQIQVSYRGAKNLRVLSDGTIAYSAGNGTVFERNLLAFQENRTIPVTPKVVNGTVRYQVGDWDRSRTLVIDPLVFSTYAGGGSSDRVNALKIAPDGSVYTAGITASTNFPTTVGAYSNVAGGFDGFVSKFASDGRTLLASTRLGGAIYEEIWSLDLDPSGNVFVAGESNSPDFPQVNPVQAYGGNSDAVIARLDPSLSSLDFSSYVGGSRYEEAYEVRLDSQGRPVIGGQTSSDDFPTTNPIQASRAGSDDAFVTRLHADLSGVDFATYLGGANDESVYTLAFDSTDGPVLAGLTASPNFPLVGSPTVHGGSYDCFITRLSPTGTSIVTSRYFGTTQNQWPGGIFMLPDNRFYLVGGSTAPTWATDTQIGASPNGGFIAKFGANGRPIWVTATSGMEHYGVTVTNSSILTTGFANSTAPTGTPGAFQETFGGGNADAFALRLSPSGQTLQYLSFLGGTRTDFSYAFGQTVPNTVLLAGTTNSLNFPISPDTATPNLVGFDDGFLSKMKLVAEPIQIDHVGRVTGGLTLALTIRLATAAGPGGRLVNLTSTNSNVITVPPTATIPQGARTVTVACATKSVAEAKLVRVNVSSEGDTSSARIGVIPPTVHHMELGRYWVQSSQRQTVRGKVFLNAMAPNGGVTITLTGDYPTGNLSSCSFPATVFVPRGKTSAPFDITFDPTATTYKLLISASANGTSIPPTQLTIAP